MNRLDTITNIYFIGIGGIGMSAVARHFNSLGVKVSGYDKTIGDLTRLLEAEGMHIHYEDNIELLDKDAQLVVYTPAIPADHKELHYYIDNNYTVIKRSDVLEMLSADTFNICVAGTHGKTTTSTMVAHVLQASGLGCTAYLGGISVNYGTNYLSGNDKICVIEADEYDRSFLKLSPDIASISAMDADHLDIYGTAEAVEEAFIDFARKLKKSGSLFCKYGMNKSEDLNNLGAMTYSLEEHEADFFAKKINKVNGAYQFDVCKRGSILGTFDLNIGGLHNIENAIVTIAICLQAGVELEKIKSGIASFKGVRRRFEYLVRNNSKGCTLIDDYAHHPEELKALIESTKDLFPGKQLCVIFQPHLFSRTKDLSTDFANVLSLSEEVVLLPIYPARELPVEGVTSTLILDKISIKSKSIIEMDSIVEWMRSDSNIHHNKVYIIAGAGDIDQLAEPFKNILETI